MHKTETTREKILLLFSIIWPIFVTQIGIYALNFIATTMSGQASPIDLAGVAIGSSLWTPILTGIGGILMALTPIISQKIGANKDGDVSFYVKQGLYLAIVITFVVILFGFFFLDDVLQLMALEKEVAHIAKHYLMGLSFGMVPLFLYSTLRGFIDALGQTRTTMTIMLLAIPVNFLFNYLFIFGNFGFPKMGGVGAGYATAITYWFILFVTLFFVTKVEPFKKYKLFANMEKISWKTWKEILLLGLPIGLTIFFETSIFATVTLLMSRFSTEIIAAHQAAMNFASMLYMAPLSFAYALTIAVGYEVGANRIEDSKSYSKIGIALSVTAGIVACFVIFVFREHVSMLYTTDENVATLIKQFLIFAIFFQLSDALNAPIQGILRGYKDVNIPFFASLISFWVIGLPFGFVTANYTELGPYGYWIGLILSLAICATILAIRLFVIQRKFQKKMVNITHYSS